VNAVHLNIKHQNFQIVFAESVAYRRAVTRRASTIVASEPLWRRHAVAKSGQVCLKQFCGGDRTASRSDFANATPSLASTLGANDGNATTETPKTASIMKAASDLIIVSC
jgi:hypothetical protein